MRVAAREDVHAGEMRSPQGAPPAIRALGDVALGLLPLLGAATATWHILALRDNHLVASVLLYTAFGGALARLVPTGLPRPGIGWANRITLVRAAMSIPVVALLLDPGFVPARGAWWIIALAGTTLALDGVDGAVARRSRTETDFGARFDMEVDAFLILILSVLVWTSTPLGVWVVGIGLIRYFFVAASFARPFLSTPLPPSLRRKAVCVVQSVALLICLVPALPGWARSGTALSALGLLVYSFSTDVRWLTAHARNGSPPRAP